MRRRGAAHKETGHAQAKTAPPIPCHRGLIDGRAGLAWHPAVTNHLEAIDTLLAGGSPLSTEERKHALRLQGDEEVEALRGVLDFADARAELFVDLADEDHGLDPTRFETALLRSRLDNAQMMAKLASRIMNADRVLGQRALSRDGGEGPTLAAYAIAKNYARATERTAGPRRRDQPVPAPRTRRRQSARGEEEGSREVTRASA